MLYKEVGKRIRKCRQNLQLTQQQLAERAGISMSFYGHIERGSRKLSMETFYKIVMALGCSADELLGIKRAAPSAADLLKQALELVQK